MQFFVYVGDTADAKKSWGGVYVLGTQREAKVTMEAIGTVLLERIVVTEDSGTGTTRSFFWEKRDQSSHAGLLEVSWRMFFLFFKEIAFKEVRSIVKHEVVKPEVDCENRSRAGNLTTTATTTTYTIDPMINSSLWTGK